MSENGDLENRIKGLVKAANCKTSWKKRLSALQEIKSIDCRQREDVVLRLALHDKVFKVKEEAFHVAQSLGLTKNGKPIKLGRKNIGYKLRDFNKTFLRIKREKKMEEFNLSLFREHFEAVAPEMFDVMLYEKDKKFDAWLESSFQNLPKQK